MMVRLRSVDDTHGALYNVWANWIHPVPCVQFLRFAVPCEKSIPSLRISPQIVLSRSLHCGILEAPVTGYTLNIGCAYSIPLLRGRSAQILSKLT